MRDSKQHRGRALIAAAVWACCCWKCGCAVLLRCRHADGATYVDGLFPRFWYALLSQLGRFERGGRLFFFIAYIAHFRAAEIYHETLSRGGGARGLRTFCRADPPSRSFCSSLEL